MLAGDRQAIEAKKWVGRIVEVVIDRPGGSRHPGYPDTVYPVDYGYVPGTMAADGMPVDAYVLDPAVVASGHGLVWGIVLRHDDNEFKLIVTAVDAPRPDPVLVRERVFFQERFFASEIILPVAYPPSQISDGQPPQAVPKWESVLVRDGH